MPNIEVHGLDRARATFIGKKIFEIICKQLSELIDDVVVTRCSDSCIDLNENPQPFLRICGPDIEEIKKIAEVLKELKIDIEILQLTDFVAANS